MGEDKTLQKFKKEYIRQNHFRWGFKPLYSDARSNARSDAALSLTLRYPPVAQNTQADSCLLNQHLIFLLS